MNRDIAFLVQLALCHYRAAHAYLIHTYLPAMVVGPRDL